MKSKLRKLAAVGVILVMSVAMVGCGGGEDTKETVTKAVQDISAAVKQPMQDMATGLMSLMGLSDTSEISTSMDPIIKSMDDALAAIDAVDTPGPDSQSYKDASKEIIQLIKDMFTDFSNMSDLSEVDSIQAKYTDRVTELTNKTQQLADDIGKKYDIDLTQYTTMN